MRINQNRVKIGTLISLFGALSTGRADIKEAPLTIEEALKAPSKISKKIIQKQNKILSKSKVQNSKSENKPRGLASTQDAGALVSVKMSSTVGVLLDEFPTEMRTRVATAYMNKSSDFWIVRAKMQIETTLYRLVFRNFFYPNKGQLPLPPKELWKVTVSRPTLGNVEGHTVVMANYKFESTLLTPENSPIEAEPKLAKIGGIWSEPFVLPVDPEYLFERTGYACMDEEDFPPNSVDSENARSFYDHSCKGGSSGCHVTSPAPKESCAATLKDKVGRIAAAMVFERIPMDQALAAKVRVGAISQNGADLAVIGDGVSTNRLIYRYITPGSCAIAEGCVGGSGWRRLLQFDASVANRGNAPAHLGEVEDGSLLAAQNMFEFSACHSHNHFSHYGNFTFGSGAETLGSKRAFCLESTSRYSNNESTPLTHPYDCHYQGIAAGWGDDYIAGIECQWVDVTPIKAPITAPLGFKSNPDQFICEGAPVLDASGNFTFVPTPFKTETGLPVNRINCNFSDGWNANNFESRNVTIPLDGSYVTAPCKRGQDSLVRNCGFKAAGIQSCKTGDTVKLKCSVAKDQAPQVLRACEVSEVLKTGTACTYRDSALNTIVDSVGKEVTFSCPSVRDSKTGSGGFSKYTAPLHQGDKAAQVSCVEIK